MSVEDVERFAQACKDDKALQEELANEGTDVEAFVAVAKRHGYDFTAKELNTAIEAKKEQLSEEELEKIAAAGDTAAYVIAVGAGVEGAAVLSIIIA